MFIEKIVLAKSYSAQENLASLGFGFMVVQPLLYRNCLRPYRKKLKFIHQVIAADAGFY